MLTAFENANPPIPEVQANKQTLLPMPQILIVRESSLEHDLQYEARNDDHMMQVVVYTNKGVVETEQRVGDRLQAVLRAAHDHIMASTAAQAAQQTLDLQTQIDQALDTAQQNVIESADAAMADRAITLEKEIGVGMEQTDMYSDFVMNPILRLSDAEMLE
ncbi:unnamed protein product [Phytophthora fragariaefolia]|uniref:Unnamed protein product n=1 Tax=Phytophthora fragariaefolia TaxID=1490495 RepID=A0A9W7D3F7_9STRA|nr:unnamed protein product [Phytophthora fragariaefolia]